MLAKRLTQYITKQIEQQSMGQIALFKEELTYVQQHKLLQEIPVEFIEKDPSTRFIDAYIERGEKETENLIAEENNSFLDEKLSYLKQHKNEYVYVEAKGMDIIGVEGILLEMDDVFGTYNAMLGLKLLKKNEMQIKEYLTNHLKGTNSAPELLFNHNDGLWDLNLAINYIEGYKDEMTFSEACSLIYSFLFHLVGSIQD